MVVTAIVPVGRSRLTQLVDGGQGILGPVYR